MGKTANRNQCFMVVINELFDASALAVVVAAAAVANDF